jgi:hypothetical protein
MSPIVDAVGDGEVLEALVESDAIVGGRGRAGVSLVDHLFERLRTLGDRFDESIRCDGKRLRIHLYLVPVTRGD